MIKLFGWVEVGKRVIVISVPPNNIARVQACAYLYDEDEAHEFAHEFDNPNMDIWRTFRLNT